MSKPLGFIPSPYGVDVAVHRHPNLTEEYLFDADAAMTMAGIYHQKDREACRAAWASYKGADALSVIYDHGGRKTPKVRLLRPKSAIYPSLPIKAAPDLPIEAWVTLVMDASSWRDRANALDDICTSNFEQAKDWAAPPEILAIGLQHLMTAALEHLPDTEIDCLEAAAFYALTLHEEWIAGGVEWLKPFRETWFRDWIKTRPSFRTFATNCRVANPDLPKWMEGDANG